MVTIAMWKFRQFRPVNTAAARIGALHRFLAIRDKGLRRKLTPEYEFGCKRPTYSNAYYRTFTKPHVHLQSSGIERVETDG
ncbi:monooxygenase, partial [Mycobacterium sp. ITM-2017-0098]